VILCGCSAQVVSSSRRTWAQAKLLGVFCPREIVADIARAARQGLDDFVACPFDMHEFLYRLNRLLSTTRDRVTSSASPPPERLVDIVGTSQPLKSLLAKLPRIAESDATCLLAGETGTGKELLARAIHYMSKRGGQAFIAINCGALPDLLFENELFGHTKGAFTDASRDQTGLIRLANKGTLFLDEIDTLSPSAQVKLLRVLQDHEYRPLGSPHGFVADIRVLAATNANLRQCVAQKSFREDLFHRLNVITLTVPSLRNRRSDIPVLAQHFLRKYARQHSRENVTLSPGAVLKLSSYDWPGNIRELEAAIERAIILSSQSSLDAEDFDLSSPSPGQVEPATTFQSAKREAIRTFEASYLRQVLAEHGGNISRAARAAGKERRAFQRLLQKYSLGRFDLAAESA